MSTEKIKEILQLAKKKTKRFLEKYEKKLMVISGVFLVSLISFQLGALQGQKWQQDPLIIEKVPENHEVVLQGVLGACSQGDTAEKPSADLISGSENCDFVGSKNSDKYHKAGCSWADRIKTENRVCFKSIQDAKDQGYVPASCLKK